jgi:hypothetical protein
MESSRRSVGFVDHALDGARTPTKQKLLRLCRTRPLKALLAAAPQLADSGTTNWRSTNWLRGSHHQNNTSTPSPPAARPATATSSTTLQQQLAQQHADGDTTAKMPMAADRRVAEPHRSD